MRDWYVKFIWLQLRPRQVIRLLRPLQRAASFDEDPLAVSSKILEFLFVAAPLKIVGGTGSPMRPIAVVDA